MSYHGVLRLADEHPRSNRSSTHPQVDWMGVVRACYDVATERPGQAFAGAWVLRRHGSWLPNLRLLAGYEIVRKEGESTRGGRRAYWVMPDPEGVNRALTELGYLD